VNSLNSTRWLTLSILVLLLGAGWIWLSRSDPGSTTAGKIPAPRTGFLAPDFSLVNQSGQSVQLSSLRGHPVVLNFWASWCSPCRTEMPALEKVYQEMKNQGLQILAVNTTYQDDPASAGRFAQERQLTFPILFDLDGKSSQQYQVRALPTTYFIDSDGSIQEIVVGGPMSEALLRIRAARLIGNDSTTEVTP
jgi:cytochrome c biogenesis protein CcmG, thiol:disulfide interchange protein DsbE